MYPVLFRLAGVPILSYTAMCFVAMFAAMVPVVLESSRLKWKIPSASRLVVLCTLFGFVGSHVLYAITRLDLGWDQWLPLFLNFGYGFVWYGGFLVSWLYCHLVARRYAIPPRQMYDVGAFACLMAQAVGRWGCIFGGCCYGSATTLPWAMRLRVPEYGFSDSVALHPVAAYESVYCVAVFAVLWGRRKRKRYEGQTAVWYLIAAGGGRFFFEFVRGDSVRGFVVGWLSTSQALALAIFAFGLLLWNKSSGRAAKKESCERLRVPFR